MDRGTWKAEGMRSHLGGCPGCELDEECYETKNVGKTGLGKYLAFALNHLYMQITMSPDLAKCPQNCLS